MAPQENKKNRTVNARQWRERIERAKTRSGSLESYCREEGVTLPALNYWRRKLRSSYPVKTEPKAPAKVPAFVSVEVIGEEASVEKYARANGRVLPDPRWVAEIILHLSGTRR